jgi:hypothetical protein
MFSSELWQAPSAGGYTPTTRGIFAYGNSGSVTAISNLVSSSGVVASDTAGVGSVEKTRCGATYGIDKAFFWGGEFANHTNLVNNQGVVAADSTGGGTARYGCGAVTYGEDGQAIIGYGQRDGATTSLSNKVSNQGAIASDTTGVGTARIGIAGVAFGGDKGIFAYGNTGNRTGAYSMSNLVSNSGVIAADVTGVGLIRGYLAACTYGGDKAIFGYGSHYTQGASPYSTTNLVSNTGVIAADVSGVGTARGALGACGYGNDKGIFGFGTTDSDGTFTAISNLVNNNGVVASDVTGVGTAREGLSAAGFSIA